MKNITARPAAPINPFAKPLWYTLSGTASFGNITILTNGSAFTKQGWNQTDWSAKIISLYLKNWVY